LVVTVGLVGTVSWLKSEQGSRYLADWLSEQVTDSMLSGELHVEGLSWDFDGNVSVSGVALRDSTTEPVASLGRLEARISLSALLEGEVHLSTFIIDGGVVDASSDENGMTRFSGLFPASEEVATPWQGFGALVDIPEISLRELVFRTGDAGAIEEWKISAEGRLHSEGTRLALDSWNVGVDGPVNMSLSGGVVLTEKTLTLGHWDVEVEGREIEVSGMVASPLMAPHADIRVVHPETGDEVHLVASVDLQASQMPISIFGEVSIADFGWVAAEGEGFGFVGEFDSSGVLAGEAGPELMLGVTSEILRVAGYTIDNAEMEATLEGETILLNRLAVGGFGASIVSSGEMDLRSGRATQSLSGNFDLGQMAPLGVTGVAGSGSVSLGLSGGNGVPWRMQGPIRLDAIRLDSGVVVHDLSGRVDIAITEDGAPSGTVMLRFGEVQMPTLHPTNGEISLSLVGNDIGFDVHLRDNRPDGELLRALGRVETETGVISFTELAFSPTDKTVWRSKDQTRVTIDEDGFSGLNARFISNAGALLAVGGMGKNRVLRVIVEGVDLGAIGELDAEWGLRGGRLNGGITVRQREQALVGEANLMVDQLILDSLLNPIDMVGKISLKPDALVVEADVNDSAGKLGEFRASIPVSQAEDSFKMALERAVSVSAFIFPSAISRLVHVAKDSPVATWEASGELVVSGLLGDPEVSLELLSAGEVPGWVNGGRVELSMTTSGRTTSVKMDALKGFNPRIRLSGTVQNRLDDLVVSVLNGNEALDDVVSYFADNLDLNVTVENAPIRDVARFSGIDVSLAGRLAGGFVVQGSWWSPSIKGAVNWIDGRMGNVHLDGAVVSLNSVPNGVDVGLFAAFSDSGVFSAEASVPLIVDARMADIAMVNGDTTVSISGDKIPLALVEGLNIGASDVHGDATISGSILVSSKSVVPNISLTLEDGALAFAPLGLYVDGVGFNLAWTERHAVLSSFTAYSRPSASALTDLGKKTNITAAGTVMFDDLSPTDVRAAIQFENAWLSATDADRYQVDGSLDLSGKWPHLHLENTSGTPLALSQGRVAFDAVSWMESGPRNLDPVIRVERSVQQVATTTGSSEETKEKSVLDNITVALELDLGRALEVQVAMPFVDDLGAMGAAISRADTVMRLDGSLSVSSQGGPVRATGEVKVLSGEVRLLQSNFTIDEGTVTFIGDSVEEPQLDLTATMAVTGGDVKMKIRGTPSVPDIQLTSDSFPEQSQILTILLTGRSPTELSDQQGTAAAGALAGLMLNSAIGGSRVGSFSLDPDGSIRMVMPNILKNVYGETVIRPMPDVDEDTWQLELEWAVTKELVLDTTMGDVNKAADLFWELRW
jgi:hypothetical protein